MCYRSSKMCCRYIRWVRFCYQCEQFDPAASWMGSQTALSRTWAAAQMYGDLLFLSELFSSTWLSNPSIVMFVGTVCQRYRVWLNKQTSWLGSRYGVYYCSPVINIRSSHIRGCLWIAVLLFRHHSSHPIDRQPTYQPFIHVGIPWPPSQPSATMISNHSNLLCDSFITFHRSIKCLNRVSPPSITLSWNLKMWVRFH